jgi:hypothetical protein
VSEIHGDQFHNRPPYQVLPLLKKHNVREIQEADIEFDGYVISKGDSFVIGYNRNHHKHRRRFTCCHELAHIIISSKGFRQAFKGCSIDIWNGGKDEELTCNRIAAELLLPREVFKKYVSKLVPSFLSLMKLSGIFEVSKEVILRQIMDLNLWDMNVVHWAPVDIEWLPAGYYAKRIFKCGKQDFILNQNYRICAALGVHRSYTNISYSKDTFKGNMIMESVRSKFSDYVLSILVKQ